MRFIFKSVSLIVMRVIGAVLVALFASAASMAAGTGEVHIQKIGADKHHPWGMARLNQDEILLTERRGRLFRVNWRSGKETEIKDIPAVFHRRQGGLLDVAIDSANPNRVYLCYARPVPGGAATALMTAKLSDEVLTDHRLLFTSNQLGRAGVHFGCRIFIEGDDIYLTLGDRGDRHKAQDLSSHAGSVIRLNRHKAAPSSSPPQGWAEALFTKGHRNPQGIARNPATGAIYVHEHGPKGGDEINLLSMGKNYGWPIVTLGREYTGGIVGEGQTSLVGYEDPLWHWTPSIAPSGMAFYKGDMFPDLRGALLVGSLRFRRLYAVYFKDGVPQSEAIIIDKKIGRIRDVMIADDGSLLLLSDEVQGGLYRVTR